MIRRARRGAVLTLTALLVVGCTSPHREAPDRVVPVMQSAQVLTSSSPAEASALLRPGQTDRLPPSEWLAAQDDSDPWVRLVWRQPQELAMVQVVGPTQRPSDPAQSTAAALHGTLRFSDGSSVVVSGIQGGDAAPTTVAFTPRKVTSVQLDLTRTIADATVGLRGLTAYGAREAPPVPDEVSAGLVATRPAASCTGRETVPGGASPPLQLICPAVGASVSGEARIVVKASPGAQVTALASRRPASGGGTDEPSEEAQPVAVGRADADGRAVLDIDTTDLPAGPLTVKVIQDDAVEDATTGVYVQLFNTAGVLTRNLGQPPEGMGLRYEDDFDGPLSATVDGRGTRYGALKPEPWGGSQFGDALFADPAWRTGSLATTDGYLRLRVQPIGDRAAEATWGQQHLGALISSQGFGGSGFSAQYGYFEARILGAPSPGTWGAFWANNSESGTSRANGESGELDVVELYGHDTSGRCHSTHSWSADKTGIVDCDSDRTDLSDWALNWHTYGALVRPGGATFFVDGKEVARLGDLSHTDEPFFFMLDLTLGGGWPIDLRSSNGIADLYVDWVRVYT